MGGSKQTTTSSNTVDPALLALYTKNDAKANEVADAYQYSPYGGERVAGFTPNQQAGQQGLLAAANDPTGTNAIMGSLQRVGGLLDYQPQQVNAGQLSTTDLSPYMNPFQKDVIDASIAQNQFARDQQGVNDNAAATAAHAFGGTRQAVQRANTTGAYDRNNQQNLADLNTANFAQARQGAQFDIGNRLTADQFNTNSGLAGANFRLNAASAHANLGQGLLADQLQRAGVQYGVGQDQQQLQQSQDDAAYEEFLRQLQTPLVAQSIRNQSLGMIPQQQTQSSTTSKSPGLFDYLSAGASVAGPLIALSDGRTKQNINTVGYDGRGRRWVDFNYLPEFGDASIRYRGVIAQEILASDPEAIVRDPSGYLMVDYSKLGDA